MPSPENDAGPSQPAGNTSADFVRKLYKMLEDPSYKDIVRWGQNGDSFVVLDQDQFQKKILPNHFKHSNFQSFIRQLNKYDFKKVKSNEETGKSPYGEGTWEFKHREFQIGRKDNLDNIRRKAPAPRKAPPEDALPTAHQVMAMSDMLSAQQHQIQALQESLAEAERLKRVLVSEVVSQRRMLKSQHMVVSELFGYMSNLDHRQRNSRQLLQSGHANNSGPNFHVGALGLLPDGADEPAPELRRAREILTTMSLDPQADGELERLSAAYNQNGSPADSAGSSVMFTQPGAGQLAMVHDPLNDPRHLVYPVGQTNGIDPCHADHINNIPYSRALSTPNPVAEAPAQITPPPRGDQGGSIWSGKQPHILLVEDDKTCARVGSKFLATAGCSFEIATTGAEAVHKVQGDSQKFDLIFMDIIMPEMDGVSATSMIRLLNPSIPIVAMTSNIRHEDIQSYFYWGINDVLAKPFTREAMVRILKKHLARMLKNPQQETTSLIGDDLGQTVAGAAGPGPPPTPGNHHHQGYGAAPQLPPQLPPSGMTMAANMANMANMTNMAGPGPGSQQVKFEQQTPIEPSSAGPWGHSPGGQLGGQPQTSPTLETAGGAAGYMTAVGNATGPGPGGMVLTPGDTQRPPPQGYGNYMPAAAPVAADPVGAAVAAMAGNPNLGGAGKRATPGAGPGEDPGAKRRRVYGSS